MDRHNTKQNQWNDRGQGVVYQGEGVDYMAVWACLLVGSWCSISSAESCFQGIFTFKHFLSSRLMIF